MISGVGYFAFFVDAVISFLGYALRCIAHIWEMFLPDAFHLHCCQSDSVQCFCL